MNASHAHRSWHRQEGSALMAAAIAAAVLGIMVVSYLAWVTGEYRLAKRAHARAQALSLCEAGLELALVELNYHYLQDSATAFAAGRGWSPGGTTATQKKTVTGLTDAAGQSVGSFDVQVAGITTKHPTLQCTGTITALNGPSLSRLVQVVVTKGEARYAIAAKQSVSMSGGSWVDSFDSSDPNKSSGGLYDITKRQANGRVGVAATSGTVLSAETIYGTAATGPGAHVSISTGIGPTTNVAAMATTEGSAEAKGWVSHDFTYDFADPLVPADLTTAVWLGDQKKGYTFTSGNWRTGALVSSQDAQPIVIDGTVRLYVTSDLTVSGSGFIQLKPNATLEIYVAGKMTISGGGVVNETTAAANNLWYGLSSSTTWTYSGSANFIGVMYAPRAKVTISGSGGVSGALVGNQVVLSGGGAVHYDEALGGGSSNSYRVRSWLPLVNRGGTWTIETN